MILNEVYLNFLRVKATVIKMWLFYYGKEQYKGEKKSVASGFIFFDTDISEMCLFLSQTMKVI